MIINFINLFSGIEKSWFGRRIVNVYLRHIYLVYLELSRIRIEIPLLMPAKGEILSTNFSPPLESCCFLAGCSALSSNSIDSAAAGVPSGDENWDDDEQAGNSPRADGVVEGHQYHDEHESY